MNIGLLISELEDKNVKRICIGAEKAANDKEITLVIMPGKRICAKKGKADDNFDYQYAALFDYANTTDFDAIIVDIERIGKNASILKKEAFLNRFGDIPMLTLTEQEGYTSVNKVENDNFEQLGYEAVCDVVFYVKNQVLPPLEPVQEFSYSEEPAAKALITIADIGRKLLHRKYETEAAYKVISNIALERGNNDCGIFLFDTKVRNTEKHNWVVPERINVKAAIINGKEALFEDGKVETETAGIVSLYTRDKNKVLIMGNIFVGEYQLGVMTLEFSPAFLIDNYFDSITGMVTAISRLSYLEKQLRETKEELYDVQEELARDDSVLDHIGDQDYLTGGLNRRGFFAKAYDLLKENFSQGKYAIVAYIYMESLKGINDVYGHDEGDRAVKKVADLLEKVFDDCIIGRIRGDEFAVIEITDDEEKAESLRSEMSTQNAKLLNDSRRYINHLQYSICEFSYEDNLSLRQMLKETDESLQRIKGNI